MDNSGLFADDRWLKLTNDLEAVLDELEFLYSLALDECAVTSDDINKIIDKLKNIELPK